MDGPLAIPFFIDRPFFIDGSLTDESFVFFDPSNRFLTESNRSFAESNSSAAESKSSATESEGFDEGTHPMFSITRAASFSPILSAQQLGTVTVGFPPCAAEIVSFDI